MPGPPAARFPEGATFAAVASPTRRRLPGPDASQQATPPSPWRSRLTIAAALAALSVVVIAYTGGWSEGNVLLDGQGLSMWLRLALRHWQVGHGLPVWIPEMWAGTPMWDLVSSFHLLWLLPLARFFGPDQAVKLGVLGAEVASAWGAFVLARSLWGHYLPALAAGLFYGLHPLFASHGAFAGQEPSLWVFAATPWLVWSLRLALRGTGYRYVAFAGLAVGFAVVQQAEHAYSLVLLCVCLLAVELARAHRRGSRHGGPAGVMLRSGVIVVIGLGICAHWLLPFATMSKSFVLTPPEDVQAGLEVLSGGLAREPGAFLSRTAPLHESYGFRQLVPEMLSMKGALASGFYLGVVCLLLTLVTVLWFARHSDEDGTLSAILIASAVGIWLSMGPVPLASGGLAERSRVGSLIAIGLVSGLLIANFLKALRLGRRGLWVAVLAALFMFAMPYVAPIAEAQRIVPFLASLRFPRLYPLAALGVALGAAFTLVLVQRWRATRRTRLAPVAFAAACILVVAGVLIDVQPYRSYYRVDPPDGAAAFAKMTETIAAADGDFRIASEFADPQMVDAAVKTGRRLSVGWPHPAASKNLWRLTAEVMENSPRGYRDSALGLSATAFRTAEHVEVLESGASRVIAVDVEPNSRTLPMVRAYERAIVVGDRTLTPELAVGLSGRHVGVVSGSASATEALGVVATGTVGDSPCGRSDPTADPQLAGDVATACAMHNWVGVRMGQSTVPVDRGAGGEFRARADGLRGVTVWLDRIPGPSELVLREKAADGTPSGREVARTTANAIDDNAMAQFSFEPIPDSVGKRYVFSLSCPACASGEGPKMFVTTEPRTEASLLVDGRLDNSRASAFSLLYDSLPETAPPAGSVEAAQPGPGRWDVTVSGPNASLVVVAESFFPGWRATVDGRPVTVLEADGAFLGVPVGPGRHVIQLSYHRPAAAGVGQAVTGLTLLVCLIMLIGAPVLRSRRLRGSDRRSLPAEPASAGAGDTLDVGTPTLQPGGERPLEPAEREPGGAGTDR